MATDAMNYGPLVETMRGVFKTGRTKTLAWRNSQLRAAVRCLEEQKGAMCEALKKDLKKDEYDSTIDEITMCHAEAQWFIDNLPRLMKARKQSVDFANIGSTAYTLYEPLGVILDIGAWNYPLQIPFSTMVNIIAAGNCVVIKPSEVSPNTAHLLAEIIPQYFDNDCVKIVVGGVPETTALLKVRWDHIMYTGSGNIGKIIYAAAAKHLTPCTLELGGKCPSYVDEGCDLEAVCNRMVWTKYKNAGQTCISVDYVLVKDSVEDAFLAAMVKAIREQYTNTPNTSPDYCSIVNERHFKRIMDLLESSPNKKVIIGGDSDAPSRYIAPTIVTNIKPEDKLMQEEIFGPILPVLKVRGHEEAIDFINAREKPLHLNVWSKNRSIIDEFIHRTSSGGVSANDALIFRVEKGLPFGGVGASGFGCYNAEGGFENFSHKKSVLIKNQGMEFLYRMMRYAPHTPEKLSRIQALIKLPQTLGKVVRGLAIVIPLAVLVGVALYLGFNKDKIFGQ